MTTSRQPKGIPVGGQFAATSHSEAGVTLAPEPDRADLVASLEQYDTDTRSRQRELRDASSEIDQERGKVGAALAVLELKKAFPAAAVVRFGRIRIQGTGVAVNPEVLDGFGAVLYPKTPYSTILDAPTDQQRPLQKALSHLSDVHDDDMEAQGIKATQRPQGTIHELDFENALALAAERSTGSAIETGERKQVDLSTPPPGEARTLGPGEHGLPDVETLTITNLGPNTKFPDRNVISFTYTLPAAANIRDLYDFDDRSRSDAYWAARYAAADLLGCKEFPEFELNGLPGDGVTLEDDGNVIFRQHDYFRPGEAVDPEDLRSWTDDLRQFSEPEARRRLESAITERYNED